MAETGQFNYRFRAGGILAASSVGLLEFFHAGAHFYRHIPEAVDVIDHAGNMSYGASIGGLTAALCAAYIGNPTGNVREITPESASRVRKLAVIIGCGATALVNCTTETRWGVQHLPIAELLSGTTPDNLDTIYSTVWAGLTAAFFVWKKVPARNTALE